VQKALDALPAEFRAAVVLCDVEGLSYEEIAATLGIKLGTVRSRIHRGRAQLREALPHLAPRPPRDDAGHGPPRQRDPEPEPKQESRPESRPESHPDSPEDTA
jgi:RNA polymerase sigma-70 factor (ECF subfamily)